MFPEIHIDISSMVARREESNGVFRVILEGMDLSTARRCGLALLSRKVPATSVLRYFRGLLMSSHGVFGRLLWLCMLTGSVGMARLGGMRGPGFGRMRMTLRDGWMRNRGCGH
jgi:hypothetical protein